MYVCGLSACDALARTREIYPGLVLDHNPGPRPGSQRGFANYMPTTWYQKSKVIFFMKTFDAQNGLKYNFLLCQCQQHSILIAHNRTGWHTVKSHEGERGKKEGFQVEALHWKHGSIGSIALHCNSILMGNCTSCLQWCCGSTSGASTTGTSTSGTSSTSDSSSVVHAFKQPTVSIILSQQLKQTKLPTIIHYQIQQADVVD